MPQERPLVQLRSLFNLFPDRVGRSQPNAFNVAFDPMWMLGERIGSTIPNGDGWFELDYEPELTDVADPTGKPDLLLAVLAPATPIDLSFGLPRALTHGDDRSSASGDAADGAAVLPVTGSPFNRLLTVTFAGRAEVGPEAAYLLRVDHDRAALFDLVPVDSSTDIRTNQERAADTASSRTRLKRFREFGPMAAVPEPVKASSLFLPNAVDLSTVIAETRLRR